MILSRKISTLSSNDRAEGPFVEGGVHRSDAFIIILDNKSGKIPLKIILLTKFIFHYSFFIMTFHIMDHIYKEIMCGGTVRVTQMYSE